MPAEPMSYDGLNRNFLAAFPEFTDSYNREFDYWTDWNDPPGIYLIFGFIVFPRVVLLLDYNENEKLLRRLFEYFEVMARSKDTKVLDLLGLEVIHKLLYDTARLREAWPYMGENLRVAAGDAAKALQLDLDLSKL
ncbi:MAG TPA: hypothetical protein VIH72_08120 [Candidatus Acidoferrales bacterium]